MAHIGIDLDGVCYNFVQAIADYAGQPTPEARTWEFFKEDWGWDRDKFLKVCRRAIREGSLFGYGYVIPGAKQGINALLDAGHRITFVTARNGFRDPLLTSRVMQRTAWWLNNELGLYKPRIIFSNDKAQVAADEGIDIFLDDKPEHIDSLLREDVTAFLFDQPWNRTSGQARVMDWPHFVRAVEVHGQSFPKLEELVGESSIFEAPSLHAETRVTSSTGGQKGSKLARFDLIPPSIWQVAELYGKGAEKYADWNWRKGYDWSLSYAALQRHAALFWAGEDVDSETGCPHMASVAFHALALLTFMEEQRQFDDRYVAHSSHSDPDGNDEQHSAQAEDQGEAA